MKKLIPVLTLIAACTSTHPNASKVRTGTSDPDKACTELGVVSGDRTVLAGGEEGARRQMKNRAARMGGNYIRLEESSGLYSSGTAYRCPDQSSSWIIQNHESFATQVLPGKIFFVGSLSK
jgi:hypothetical protein